MEAEVHKNIASIRSDIASEVEVTEMVSRIRKKNFTLASNGKNKAQHSRSTLPRKRKQARTFAN